MTYESNTDVSQEREPPQIRVTYDTLVFLDLVIMGWIVTMKDLEIKRSRSSAAANMASREKEEAGQQYTHSWMCL